jgi:hypothetical protein
MPANLTEFTDDTAFERYLLDRGTPLLPTSQGTSVIELGEAGTVGVAVGVSPAVVRVSAGDSSRSPGDQLSADDIRPLLFGAAWKVLDLLCELALEQAGIAHQGTRYLISFKVEKATNGTVMPVSLFHGHPDLWARIMGIYGATEELRNSLMHRRLIVDPVTGEMSGVGKPGHTAPTPVNASEQLAFCKVAEGAAEAVINGTLPGRRGGQLAWALDQLTAHHGQSPFGASPMYGLVPQVIVPAAPEPSGDLTLDFDGISSRARAAVQGVSHYDLEIHLPDSRVLAGALEDAPAGQGTISLADPPNWLRWI